MKNILIAMLAATTVAQAADLRSISLLGAVSSVMVSNTIAPTNLVGATITTNVQGTVFTNLAGTKITVSAAGSGATQNTLGQADLQPFLLTPNVNSNGTFTAGSYQPTYATFSAKLKANSGANAAVTFVLAPVPDGANMLTEASYEWAFSFTPTASTTHVIATNVPLVNWPGPLPTTGMKAIRLKRIVNADTDASSDVYVSDCYLNTVVP